MRSERSGFRWDLRSLSAVADVDSGAGFPLQFQGLRDGTFPFFKVGDMSRAGNETTMQSFEHSISEEVRQTLRAKAFPAGSVVFPKIGAAIATNKKRLLTRPSCVDNNVMAVAPGAELEPRFLFYLFAGKNLLEFANDSNPPSIRKTTVEAWEIPVPPLAEQRRLVARIETLTSRLEQARQARQAALAEGESVFQRTLEIAFSDDATEDWNEHDADELFEIVGGQVSPHDAEFRDLPYLGPEHIEAGTSRIIGERVSVAELKMKSGKYRFTPEHVVYSKIRPALRKVCTPDYSGLCSADMYALQPNPSRISREFLKFLLLAPAFSDYAVEKSDRNAMPKINQTTLRAFRFRVPDRATQRRIVTRLDALSAKQTGLRRLQTETEAELTAFTPALLAKAFRGEL